MAHYYEHEGESFGPRWMQDELDKHGRYLNDFERGLELRPRNIYKNAQIVSYSGSRWIIKKIGKKNIHLSRRGYDDTYIIKLPRNFILNNFKLYNSHGDT